MTEATPFKVVCPVKFSPVSAFNMPLMVTFKPPVLMALKLEMLCWATESGAPMAVPSFTWSSRTARRGLGLAAVRALVGGTATSPEEGVRAAIAGSLRAVRQGAGPVASMDHWLAALPAAGRAAVGAEAITWATRLWCALDWTAFEAPPLIGRDLWWDSPGAPVLGLRSRAEVRAGTSRLVVLGGARRSTVRAELSVVALVEALRAGASVVPGRVMGWWPDSGHHVRVDLDQAVLEEGVAVVARIVQRGLVGAAV